MSSTKAILACAIFGAVAVTTSGCRNDTTTDLPDLSKKASTDMAVTPSTDDGSTPGGGDMQPIAYPQSTIAAMRTAQKSGYFELVNVVVTGMSSSTSSPKGFVQDAAGGDFSAIVLSCKKTASGSTPACPVFATYATLTPGAQITVDGSYRRTKATGFEEFVVSNVTVNGTASQPAQSVLAVADIKRSAVTAKAWYQHVKVNVGVADTLKMFDFSPAEFKYASFSDCTKVPAYFGFAMLPTSSVGIPGGVCMGMTQPAGQATVNNDEIMIGTDFYKSFGVSADCACAAVFKNKEPTAASTVSGMISGYMYFDSATGAAAGYQIFIPDSDAGFPLTNTM